MRNILKISLLSLSVILLSGCSEKVEEKDIKLSIINKVIEIENEDKKELLELKEIVNDNKKLSNNKSVGIEDKEKLNLRLETRNEIKEIKLKEIEKKEELLEEIKDRVFIEDKKKEEIKKILENNIKKEKKKIYYEMITFEIETKEKNCPDSITEKIFNENIMNKREFNNSYSYITNNYYSLDKEKNDNSQMFIMYDKERNINLLACFYQAVKR